MGLRLAIKFLEMNVVKGRINSCRRNWKVVGNQGRYFLCWKIFKHNYVPKRNKST